MEDNCTVLSTSTRNFNNHMGKGVQVYLGSAELAPVGALLGKIPTVEDYLAIVAQKVDPFKGDLYRYLNFDEIDGFEDFGRVISVDKMPKVEDVLV